MANEQNLISLKDRTERERHEISAKGGRATKGIPKPSMWRCRGCPYARNNTCGPGINLIKNAGKTITGQDNRQIKVDKNPRCIIPEARRIVMESGTDVMGLVKMTKHFFTEAAFKASTVEDNVRVGLATLKLAQYIEPPLQRQLQLTTNVDVNVALEIVYTVLVRKKTWRKAIEAIREEFMAKYGGTTQK